MPVSDGSLADHTRDGSARVVVNDGTSNGEEEHLCGHRDRQRLGELLGVFHVADEGRDQGVPVK